MTKRLQIYCAIVISVSAAQSFAQEKEKEQARPAERGVGALLRALDSNADGELDQSEIDLAVASLRKLDRNGDGKISRDELGSSKAGDQPRRERPEPEPGGDERRAFDFSTLDTDGDGKISKEEAPERMKERFDRVDRNGDGLIDKEEQEVIARFLRQRMQQGADGGKGQQRRRDADEGQGGSEKPKRPASDQ